MVPAKKLRIQVLIGYREFWTESGRGSAPFELFLPKPSLSTTSSAHRILLRGNVSALNLKVPTCRGIRPCDGCGVVSNCVVLPVGAGTAGARVAVIADLLMVRRERFVVGSCTARL